MPANRYFMHLAGSVECSRRRSVASFASKESGMTRAEDRFDIVVSWCGLRIYFLFQLKYANQAKFEVLRPTSFNNKSGCHKLGRRKMSLTDQFLPSVQNLHLGGRRQMTNAASAEGSWI